MGIIIGMRCISKLKAFQQHLIFKWAKITPSIHPSTSLHRKTCFGHHYPSQQSVCAIIGGALRCPTPHLEDKKKKKNKKKKKKKKKKKFAVKRPSHMVPTITMPRSHWRKPDLTGESPRCRQQLGVKATDILECYRLAVSQLGVKATPWIAGC